MVIPDILLYLEFDEGKNSFDIKKIDSELKGNLYPINPWKELEHKVGYFLDKIKGFYKNRKMSKNDDDEINMNLGKEYESIISDIEKNIQILLMYFIAYRFALSLEILLNIIEYI